MKKLFACVLLFGLLLSGCWDLNDIDERSFVLGVAFDKEQMGEKYVMSIEIPVLANLGAEKGVSADQSLVLSTTGTAVAQMIKSLELRNWRPLFFGHTKIIVFGEEVAREGIWSFLNFFERNPHTDLRLKVFIADGEARDVLQTSNPREPLASIYLNRLTELESLTARTITQNFQDSLIRLHDTGNTILPRVRSTETEFVIGGGALIKDWKLIAWLGENEAFAAQFLFDEVTRSNISVKLDEYIYSVFVSSSSTKIKPVLISEQLAFKIDIKIECNVNEVFSLTRMDTDYVPLKEIENKVTEFVTDLINHLLEKLQSLKVDPFAFSQLTFRYYPEIWTKHKNHWDEEFFPQIQFLVNCETQVRQTGILE